MSHEGWGKRGAGDSAARVELVDPGLGEIGVVGLVVRTHGHEELAELLVTARTNQEVLGEAIVQSPTFDADGLLPVFPEAEDLGLRRAFVGVERGTRTVNPLVSAPFLLRADR